MKKPVLLLVDDEPAVLEALENALAPAFEELCRIEAFAGGQEVLEQVPRWAEEKRSVAVAIVDQKMPGMTGVDLVRRLRGEGPAQQLRALLLTGYAGLDSAVAAKNEAGVDRYLEKPWLSEDLVTAVGALLRASLAGSGALGFYRLAPVRQPDDLVAVFQLRYRVYRMFPALFALLRENEDEAALDSHDRFSIIMGLWHQEGAKTGLVGTLRMVSREPSPVLEALREAARRLPAAGEDLEGELEAPFPSIVLFPKKEELVAFLTGIEKQGGRIAEVGKHALLPEHRAGNMDRRQTEGTFAFSPLHRLTHAWAGIPTVHRRHYVLLGFEEIPEVERSQGALPLMAIWSTKEKVREPVRSRVQLLERRIAELPEAGLCFCPGYPDCLPEPYLTGDFRGTDVFCPLVAGRFLDGEGSTQDKERP